MIASVPSVGQLLQQYVVVVAHADSDGRKVDALTYAIRDPPEYALRRGQADVGHPVRQQDHPRSPVLIKMLKGHPVPEGQSGVRVG